MTPVRVETQLKDCVVEIFCSMVILHGDKGLIFSDTYAECQPLVFEVSDELLDFISTGNARVKFSKNGEAFLNDENDTYTLRQVDNSNTQLLVKQRNPTVGNEIMFTAQRKTEVTKLNIKTVPDKEIAEIFLQRGSGKSGDILPYLCYDSIWSEARIVEHLRMHDNYYMEEGRWLRLSDDEYFSVIDLLLGACAILGASNVNEFNSEEVWMTCSEALEADGAPSVSLSFAQYLLSRLSDNESECFKNKGEFEWSLMIPLNVEKVMYHRARQVLHKRLKGGKCNVNLDIFLTEWKELLETTVLIDSTASFDVADNIARAIRDRAVLDDGNVLIALDSRQLSFDVKKRLEELFKVKSKWLKTELEDLMLPVIPGNVKVEAVLLKSCRLDIEVGPDANDIMLYSSRF